MENSIPIYDCAYIIDDDAAITLLHSNILEKSGVSAEIKAFANPSTALDHLGKDIAFPEKNVLILLDINMPEMSGFEFLDAATFLRYPSSRQDVFMITSSLDPIDLEKGKAHPLIREYILKPFSGKDLMAFVETFGMVSK